MTRHGIRTRETFAWIFVHNVFSLLLLFAKICLLILLCFHFYSICQKPSYMWHPRINLHLRCLRAYDEQQLFTVVDTCNCFLSCNLSCRKPSNWNPAKYPHSFSLTLENTNFSFSDIVELKIWPKWRTWNIVKSNFCKECNRRRLPTMLSTYSNLIINIVFYLYIVRIRLYNQKD